MSNLPNSKFSIRQIFNEAFILYRHNLALLVTVCFLGNILSILDIAFGLSANTTNSLASFISVLALFFNVWGYMAIIVLCGGIYRGQVMSIREAFAQAKGMGPFIAVLIFYFLVVSSGFLAGIIPAIYFGTIFVFAPMSVVLNHKNFWEAFAFSRYIVKGSFGKVFLTSIILTIISSLLYSTYWADLYLRTAMLLFHMIAVFVVPFTVMVYVHAYYHLKEHEPETFDELTIAPTTGKILITWLVAIGLFVAISYMSYFWMKQTWAFLNSPQGKTTFEWVSEKISVPVTLPEGVTLKRPEGWLVLKEERPLNGYQLFSFDKEDALVASLNYFRLTELDKKIAVDKNISDSELGESTVKYFIPKVSRANGLISFEQIPIGEFQLNGRIWIKHILKKEKSSRSLYFWVWYLSRYKDGVVVLNYEVAAPQDKNSPAPENILAEKQNEMKTVLTSITFPPESMVNDSVLP